MVRRGMGNRSMDNMTATYRVRAAAYVIRGESGAQEVLVFDHVHYPEAGTQVPGGGVDPGETLDEATRREVLEETGLLVTGTPGSCSAATSCRCPGQGRPGTTTTSTTRTSCRTDAEGSRG